MEVKFRKTKGEDKDEGLQHTNKRFPKTDADYKLKKKLFKE